MRIGRLVGALGVCVAALAAGCVRLDEPGANAPDIGSGPDAPDAAPEGADLAIKLDRPIGTDVSFSGDTFSGVLGHALRSPEGAPIAAAGARVTGTIVDVTLHPPTVTVRFDSVETARGNAPLEGVVIDTKDASIAVKRANRRQDDGRFSTLTPRAVGDESPPATRGESPAFVDDATRDQLRVAAGTVLQVRLTKPLALAERR